MLTNTCDDEFGLNGPDVQHPHLRTRTLQRILLAVTNDWIRHQITQALRGEGYDIIETSHGIELINYIGEALLSQPKARPADLIIIEPGLPGWSGLQVLADLWQQRWAPPVAIIAAPGGDGITIQRAIELGAAAVFQQPINVAQLKTITRSLLPPAGECQ